MNGGTDMRMIAVSNIITIIYIQVVLSGGIFQILA